MHYVLGPMQARPSVISPLGRDMLPFVLTRYAHYLHHANFAYWGLMWVLWRLTQEMPYVHTLLADGGYHGSDHDPAKQCK